MGFAHFNDNNMFVDRNGQSQYLIGTNFAAGYVCTNFWADWRPDSIKRDLDIMQEMGFNCVRIPIMWGTFEPEEGKFSEVMLERLDSFLNWCLEREIYVMPWCLVGVSTGMYDVPWRNGRSFLFDESMVQAEEYHLMTLGKRFKDCENLLCWDITDEPEWYSRMEKKDTLPYPTEEFTKWVARMANAFRKVDTNHKVTLGFGHLATGRYGMDLRDCANQLDFMAVTAYAGTHGGRLNAPRPTYEIQYHMDMNRRNGPCYFCEAPGHSHTMHSEETIAHYYNTTIFSGLLHHSCGVLPWVFSDYDEDICCVESGANRHPNEPWYGMLDEKRNKKKCAVAFEKFGKTVREYDITKYHFPQNKVALIVPRGYHSASIGLVCEMISAHAVLCGADIQPKMVWWDELDPSETPVALLAAPNEQEILTQDWKGFAEYVEAGGTLIMTHPSYSIYFYRMTGCIYDDNEDHKANSVISFTKAFGTFRAEDRIDFKSVPKHRTVIEPFCGEILATFSDGAPALVRNHFGKGTVYTFAVNPIPEMYASPEDEWHDSPIFKLIRTIVEEAGVCVPTGCDDPGVETGLLNGAEDDLLVIVNSNRMTVEKKVDVYSCKGKSKYSNTFNLAPGEAKIIRIEH